MPFGIKPDPRTGGTVDFDQIYEAAIRPAITAAGLLPIRADQERTGGVIHTPMFERLLLCEYVVADTTTANANVFYELGIRHAALPNTTLPIFASHSPPPFDINFLRGLPYDLGRNGRLGRKQAKELTASLTTRLKQLRAEAGNSSVDSPVFQLLPQYTAPDTSAIDSDAFYDVYAARQELHEQIHQAVDAENNDGLLELQESLGSLTDVDPDILLHLVAGWRRLSAWQHILDLSDSLTKDLRQTSFIQELRVHALAQLGEHRQAERLCEQLIARHGSSPERSGLLGRTLKDQWQAALRSGDTSKAAGILDRAIDVYADGYRQDHRDTYPGINAITLCELSGTSEHQDILNELLPIVRYAHLVPLRTRRCRLLDPRHHARTRHSEPRHGSGEKIAQSSPRTRSRRLAA